MLNDPRELSLGLKLTEKRRTRTLEHFLDRPSGWQVSCVKIQLAKRFPAGGFPLERRLGLIVLAKDEGRRLKLGNFLRKGFHCKI